MEAVPPSIPSPREPSYVSNGVFDVGSCKFCSVYRTHFCCAEDALILTSSPSLGDFPTPRNSFSGYLGASLDDSERKK